ncbi:MAG: site-specific DNA-methyltransferase [Flavobacteriales bacterium]|nr:site-specific DNA-methyltransferase [Flavobacteriales bacterium]
MAEPNLQPDEQALLALLPTDGSTIGNGKARQTLGWDDARYEQAKTGLIAKGVAVAGRGRGGSLARTAGSNGESTAAEPEADFALSAPEPEPAKAKTKSARAKSSSGTSKYQHPESSNLVRPEIGVQAHFKKRKEAATYRYDSSLAPTLQWDENPARPLAEWLMARIDEAAALEPPHQFPHPQQYRGADGSVLAEVRGLRDAVDQLRRMQQPFLEWTGKAEKPRLSVPTVPLFVHERLSTEAIIKTLKGHRKDQQTDLFDQLFGVEERSLADQAVHAYEHAENWTNRMILGDSLVVMNSLLQYEHLAGQVQMIYMDPPYGVKFGSNFQPFVRKRDVKHNEDESLTREPEMVQAYRDTWELGLHSYLTYLRDRLKVARDLLSPTGSIFVQISDENLHHVREVMDEVFGMDNGVVTIVFKKKSATTPTDPVNDYILWYARDRSRVKSRPLFLKRRNPDSDPKFNTLISPEWDMRRIAQLNEGEAENMLANGWRWARVNYPLVSQDENERSRDYEFNGKKFSCGKNRHWTFDPDPEVGMGRLAKANRLFDGGGQSLGGLVFWDDWPFVSLSNVWDDIHGDPDPIYVVQTSYKVISRCVQLATDPGDLVLDPTCGSGSTAFVAEQWGRRWITIDTSRVPLALARQRLLTATFDFYELMDAQRGPAGGFVYKRKQNKKGEEVGGIVPHITLKSIANNEPPKEEVLVDRPEKVSGLTRVTGPFTVEATIPTAEALDEDPETPGIQSAQHQTYVQRMIEVLRRAPVLSLPGNKKVSLKNVREPAKTMALSAEAIIPNGEDKPVAILFGPENGPLSERLVREAWREAELKNYSQLFVIGFGIDPKAREFIEKAGQVGIPATWHQATMDLQMGDLLKNMRSSQVFSLCGLPDAEVRPVKPKKGEVHEELLFEVELSGLDTFDPVTMENAHINGSEVPCWLLDTDYNGLVFRVRQAFFPKTGAWDNLKRALRADFADTVWDHLAGTLSAPFPAGEHKQVAVKVIDPRGNELLVVKELEAKR